MPDALSFLDRRSAPMPMPNNVLSLGRFDRQFLNRKRGNVSLIQTAIGALQTDASSGIGGLVGESPVAAL
jgi:hypothetical protein